MNAVVLGDGNLSFSYVLAAATSLETERVRLYATTFDTLDKLHDKYPEVDHYLQTLHSKKYCDAVVVKHGINSLYLASHFPSTRFSWIIFNFPHVGIEDLQVHQAFLAHFVQSCDSVLAENGLICLALAESQEIGWKLMESAHRLGYELSDKIELVQTDWPGYDFRRHQTGKSFRQRVGICFHYCLRRRCDTSPVPNLLRQAVENIKRDTTITAGSDLPVEPSEHVKKSIKSKKRCVHQLVEGHYEECRDPNTSGFVCLDCGRNIATEQGIRTHVYSMHILGGEGDEEKGAVDGSHRCTECGKECANADALRQHTTAKHSSQSPPSEQVVDVSLVPDPSPSTIGPAYCAVCGWHFSSDSDRARHDQLLAPHDASYDYACKHCQKLFASQRSVDQHERFCRQQHNNEAVTSVVADTTASEL